MGNRAILVVDDDLAFLRTTDLILRNAGYTVSAAASAADAVRLLGSDGFDLLLLDCIPGHSRLISEAKRANPHMRVAVCTADPEIIELPQVDVVFDKPISSPVLLNAIAELIPASRAA